MTKRPDDEEAAIRMTARIHEVEPGVFEGDYTIEPPNAADPETEYVKQFTTRAEARRWLEAIARTRDVDPSEIGRVEE